MSAFSGWAQTYVAAPAGERQKMERAGISLAKKRREIVQTLIQNHPKLALAEAVPMAVRNELPASILGLLEERITGRGDLMVLGRAEAQSPVARRAVINGRSFDAFVFGERNAQQSTRQISLHGIAVDGQLALSESSLRAFEAGETIPADKPLADPMCSVSGLPAAPTVAGALASAVPVESADRIYWLCRGGHLVAAADGVTAAEVSASARPHAASGPRSVLVMLVDFPDLAGGPTTPEAARATLETVASFLEKNSVGKFAFQLKTVTRVLRLPELSTTYGNPSQDAILLDDARGAARGAGYAPESYDFDVVAFANIGQPWSGQGYVGDKGAWVQGNLSAGTLAHELGHNLGLWHANSWISSSIIGSHGIHDEYGNVFDIMGLRRNVPDLHYSANFKRILGWLGEENIETVSQSGTYRIYAHDQNSLLTERKYGIRIPVGIVAGGEVEDYWIDFRQLVANRYPVSASGAIVQWGNDRGSQSASRLLDTNPQTQMMEDAPLGLNRTMADPDRSLSITPLAKAGEGADAYLDVQITLTPVVAMDLNEALDTTNWAWATSASAWVGQRTDSHDGVDAGASGATADNGSSYVETQLQGPGALSFWWKVSSEETFDQFRLLDNGVELARISGEVGWQKRTFELGPGSHTLRWGYKKDGSAFAGADRAWLDQVSFDSEERPPYIDVPPSPVAVEVGADVTFQVLAGGSAPLSYQWMINGEPMLSATNTSLTITNAQTTNAALYSVRVTNPFGSETSGDALLTVTRPLTLVEALDWADAKWSTTPTGSWKGVTGITHDGVDAAQCGSVQHGGEATMEAKVDGPGTLTFWWKVSSEETFDFLSFYLDGELVEQVSGEREWVQKVLIIPNGTHRIRWTYAKDNSVNGGSDCGWVDQVRFDSTGNSAPVILSNPAAQEVGLGGMAVFTVEYYGAEDTTFQWFHDDVPMPAGLGRAGVNEPTLIINNVGVSDAGRYTVRVTNAHGEDLSDSAALTIVGLSLGDSVEQGGRIWRSGGAGLWKGQTVYNHDGVDAAGSPAVGDNQEAWFETVVHGPGTVAFWWEVSSEADFDFLNLELDGVVATSISGEVSWERVSFDFGPGEHTLRWSYRKDRNTGKFLDAGWVDQIEITESPVSPRIEHMVLSAGNVSGRIAALTPFSGEVVLEASPDLENWTPILTNQVTGATMNFNRSCAVPNEFLRAKVR